jgi:hypothetical protein
MMPARKNIRAGIIKASLNYVYVCSTVLRTIFPATASDLAKAGATDPMPPACETSKSG